MIQADKDLLLKDLCARLPYRVKGTVTYRNGVGKIYNVIKYINGEIYYKFSEKSGIWYDNIVIKPYLFPLSSMTEEQKEDLLLTIVGKEGLRLFSVTKDGIISNDKAEQSFENFSLNNINFSNKNIEVYIDWLNKNHFDFRGLIEKGLAIDCTNLNIY